MTDEEKAEQFAENISGPDPTLSAKDEKHAYRLGRYDGYLAGLKAGRQWHKVTESLPEMGVFVYLWHPDHKFPAIAFRHKERSQCDWYWDCNHGDYYVSRLVSIDRGYLWKEIVLPELKEK